MVTQVINTNLSSIEAINNSPHNLENYGLFVFVEHNHINNTSVFGLQLLHYCIYFFCGKFCAYCLLDFLLKFIFVSNFWKAHLSNL